MTLHYRSLEVHKLRTFRWKRNNTFNGSPPFISKNQKSLKQPIHPDMMLQLILKKRNTRPAAADIAKAVLLTYALFAGSQCIDSNFPSEWSGYWIAKRRQDVYAADQATCQASPFVWVKENTTSGQLSEQSWESTMWHSGQPDCAVNYPRSGMLETCCHFAPYFEFHLNDASCWYPHCPFCQMEAG